MTTIELVLPDRSAVTMNLPAPLIDQIQSASDCWAVARAIMFKLPLEALPFIEAVRVRLSDEIGAVFTVQEFVRQLTGAKYLVHGVHMEAFRRVLARLNAQRICLCW